MHFDGVTYDPVLDQRRLATLLRRVWTLMQDGQFRTLPEIAAATKGSEASVSARLRDLRKRRHGAYTVERRRRTPSLHEYRVVTGASRTRP